MQSQHYLPRSLRKAYHTRILCCACKDRREMPSLRAWLTLAGVVASQQAVKMYA